MTGICRTHKSYFEVVYKKGNRVQQTLATDQFPRITLLTRCAFLRRQKLLVVEDIEVAGLSRSLLIDGEAFAKRAAWHLCG